MIAFIIPIRHPANALSYSRIEALLDDTLASLCNTRSNDYRVIVVCCRAPATVRSHPNVEFLVVDFPPPGDGKATALPAFAMRQDKGLKILVGFLRARALGAQRIMFVDGDDFVHRDLAAYCNDQPETMSMRVAQGFMYRDGSAIVSNLDDFSAFCGTSIILSIGMLSDHVEKTLTANSPYEEILAKADMDFVRFALGSHSRTAAYFAERGVTLAPAPIRGAVWRTGSAESHSGIKFAGAPKIATQEIIDDFKLPIVLSAGVLAKSALFELPAFYAKDAIRSRLRGKG
ncbi:MAG TPA: hypothetical protein DDZ68_13670 [Parvularcula sp.]|nr:hypothetical protein [Parvularcula sp.]HBS30631.1 hypothetical protein [Parvularcula sp.]HBS36105.1 hypothetical protein [Parvularcula sp.]